MLSIQQKFLLYWISAFTLMLFPTESTSSPGCGKSIPSSFSPGQTTTIEIPPINDQPVRHYNVHLPTNFQNDRGHALVFSFHGHNGNMSLQENLSQLSQNGLLIQGPGIIAVYPQGKIGTDGGTAWQGAPYSAPAVNDVRSFKFCVTSVRKALLV